MRDLDDHRLHWPQTFRAPPTTDSTDFSPDRGAAPRNSRITGAAAAALLDNGVAEKAEAGRPILEEPASELIVGSSRAIRALRERIRLLAVRRETVLITGETGTGKELAARALHRLSPRSDRALIAVNAGALQKDLIGSDLFGHVKGAFTGADSKRMGAFVAAHGGALHLDEIGELPLALQATLLRVVEDGIVRPLGSDRSIQVDVRLIAATNKDLRKRIAAGEFREDLFYRLNVLRLELPPLRDREDDVLEIADHYLARLAARDAGCNGDSEGVRKRLSRAAMDKLRRHTWPGNVRELISVLSGAACLAAGEVIDAELIEFGAGSEAANPRIRIDRGRDLVTEYLAARALEASDGNVSAAARIAGVSRPVLHKLKAKLEADRATPDSLFATLRAELGVC